MNGNMELYNPNNELKKMLKSFRELRQKIDELLFTANQYSRYFVIFLFTFYYVLFLTFCLPENAW